PIIYINVTDTPQGLPALCVTGKGTEPPVYDRRLGRFNHPAILILNEYDLWTAPINETLRLSAVDFNFNPGINETISIISAAVNDPQVVVIASVQDGCNYKCEAFDLIKPYRSVTLDMPNQSERKALYKFIKSKCPSIKDIEMEEFIKLTKNLSRTDILYASQYAVEEAYKKSIEQKSLVMVRPSDLYQKLAQRQDLESPEYKRLENAVVMLSFKNSDELESLFNKGSEKI
ncbi:MAG: hypothetical protein HUJ51_05260, partial [Eggerthellaceae bacterium]|nr:hypothetical protein [Eggerthellaceae bacterium]